MKTSSVITILTIDDEDIIRQIFTEILEECDYRVIGAENGEKGIALFREQKPDLMLVDIEMPVCDGLEVLSVVVKESPETPIIMVSGTGDVHKVVKALSLGAWDFITKPVKKMEILLHSVEKNLERASLIKESRKYQERLEVEVAEKTSYLRESLQELSNKNKELETILYSGTHDLRSPLINIQGYGSLLSNTCQNILETITVAEIPPTVKETLTNLIQDDIDKALEFIKADITKIGNLITGLLTFGRISNEKIQQEPLNMNNLVKDVLKPLKAGIKELGLDLTIETLPQCMSDETQVYHILESFIKNAVMFRDDEKKGKIRIWGEEKDGKVTYYIEDNGIGIEEQYFEKIFNMFYQLDPLVYPQGDGLGLALAQKRAGTIKGTISVKSVYKEGSTFTLTLPAS
ncbi:MAG: response regulator [bacterium]|nr:response regulator [bacterium]